MLDFIPFQCWQNEKAFRQVSKVVHKNIAVVTLWFKVLKINSQEMIAEKQSFFYLDFYLERG